MYYVYNILQTDINTLCLYFLDLFILFTYTYNFKEITIIYNLWHNK